MNVCLPADALEVSGEVRWHASKADSGNDMKRGFCPECGTPLFSNADQRPHLTFVRAGALDDPGIAAPQATIWTKEAPEWACINPDIPAHEGQLPPVA